MRHIFHTVCLLFVFVMLGCRGEEECNPSHTHYEIPSQLQGLKFQLGTRMVYLDTVSGEVDTLYVNEVESGDLSWDFSGPGCNKSSRSSEYHLVRMRSLDMTAGRQFFLLDRMMYWNYFDQDFPEEPHSVYQVCGISNNESYQHLQDYASFEVEGNTFSNVRKAWFQETSAIFTGNSNPTTHSIIYITPAHGLIRQDIVLTATDSILRSYRLLDWEINL